MSLHEDLTDNKFAHYRYELLIFFWENKNCEMVNLFPNISKLFMGLQVTKSNQYCIEIS
jgi:hypothetical protein